MACGTMQHWKTFGTCQMQAHIYSPSRQLPKTAKAQTWMKKVICRGEELLQHRVSSLLTSVYWRFGCVLHDMLQKSTWQRKRKHSSIGAFTRVPQVDQRGWINEIEFNRWTILFTQFYKGERGSRFQNGGKWTFVREGVVICDCLMKECQHVLEKKK